MAGRAPYSSLCSITTEEANLSLSLSLSLTHTHTHTHMKASPSPFPIFFPPSNNLYVPLKSHILKLNSVATSSSCKAASVIPAPPSNFNFKNEILDISTAAIAESHPELLDLAKNGTVVLIKKSQYGPVPPWRSEFVEPEAIWIIGATHISRESASDVERVIRVVRPDNVVVELCRSRAGIMYTPENVEQNQQLRSSMFSLSGTGFFGAIGRSINLGGQTALALRLLLATFSSKVSSDINRPFGDEFRAARKASEEISAQLVLGDRPIEITVSNFLANMIQSRCHPWTNPNWHDFVFLIYLLNGWIILTHTRRRIVFSHLFQLERAWSSLKWKEKLSLVTSVIRGIMSSDLPKETLEEPNASDGSFQLYEQLSFSYPSLLPSLIHERDVFLAWSLKRSKAVNNSKKVVGVIGKGHMNGVIYSLLSDTGNLRFRDLAGKRPGSDGGWAGKIVNDLLRDTIIGVVLWLVYEQFKSML